MAGQSIEQSNTVAEGGPARQSDQNGSTRECIDNCTECHRLCLETALWCLQQGGDHAEASHIRLLLDCADICRTSADFMTRGSDFHAETCRLCAELCERCAESCEGLGEDEQMKECVEVCRRCAGTCREMGNAGIMESENGNRSR